MANEALKTGGAIFLLGYLLGRRKFRRAIQLGMFTATRQLGASPRELLTAGVGRLMGSEEVRDAGKSIGSQLVVAALTAPAGRLAESLHRRNAELAGGGERRSERGGEREGGDREDGASGEGDGEWRGREPLRRGEGGNGHARGRYAEDDEEGEESEDWGDEEESAPARRSRRPAARSARGSGGGQRTAKRTSTSRTSPSGAARSRGAQAGRGAARTPRSRQATRGASGPRGGGRQKAATPARARRNRGR